MSLSSIPPSANPKGEQLIIVLGLMLALDVIFVGLRLWARQLTRKTLTLNDYAVIASLVFLIALFGVELVLVRRAGAGLHVTELLGKWNGIPRLILAGKLLLTANVVWNLSMLTFKISILHFYIEIFGHTSPRFRRITWVVMGICTASTVALIIQIFFLCRPLALFWDKSITEGSCGSLIISYTAAGVINTALDFAIFALPLPVVWRLQMAFSKKLATTGVFTIGFGICVIASVRLKYVIRLDQQDFTYSIWYFAMLGTLEPMVGAISACLPVVPPVISHVFRPMPRKGYSHGESTGTSSRTYVRSGSQTRKPVQFSRLDDDEYPLADIQRGESGNGRNEHETTRIHVRNDYTVEFGSSNVK